MNVDHLFYYRGEKAIYGLPSAIRHRNVQADHEKGMWQDS